MACYQDSVCQLSPPDGHPARGCAGNLRRPHGDGRAGAVRVAALRELLAAAAGHVQPRRHQGPTGGARGRRPHLASTHYHAYLLQGGLARDGREMKGSVRVLCDFVLLPWIVQNPEPRCWTRELVSSAGPRASKPGGPRPHSTRWIRTQIINNTILAMRQVVAGAYEYAAASYMSSGLLLTECCVFQPCLH